MFNLIDLWSGRKVALPPPRTTAELLASLAGHLVRSGLRVAIDPDGVTAATGGRTWRIAAVADDGEPGAAAPCRCGREDDAMAFPRRKTGEEHRRELLEFYRWYNDLED